MFAFAFGWIEILFMLAFFLMLVVGITFDRSYNEDVKWYVLGIGLIGISIWFWPDWTFAGSSLIPAEVIQGVIIRPAQHRIVLWEAIRSWAFWYPLSIYLSIGLVYSGIEFILNIRREARFYASEWQHHLKQPIVIDGLNEDGTRKKEITILDAGDTISKFVRHNVELSEVYSQIREMSAKSIGFSDGQSIRFNEGLQASKSFIQKYSFENRIVELELSSKTDVTVEPKINKVELAEHLGAWMFLWPAYMVSLIFGEFLTGLFRILAKVFVKLSSRFVRMSFSNVFKF